PPLALGALGRRVIVRAASAADVAADHVRHGVESFETAEHGVHEHDAFGAALPQDVDPVSVIGFEPSLAIDDEALLRSHIRDGTGSSPVLKISLGCAACSRATSRRRTR